MSNRKTKNPTTLSSPTATGHSDHSEATLTGLDQLRPDPEIEALWQGTTPTEDDRTLEESIRRVGCLNPIIATENGDIVDGRRRWYSLKKLGKKECLVIVVKIKAEDKLALAVELNANRRQLTLKQKKQLVRKLLKRNPAYSARELGRIVVLNHNTAEAVKKEMLAAKEIEKVAVVDRRGYRHVGGVVTSLGGLAGTVRGMDKIKKIEGILTTVPEPERRKKDTTDKQRWERVVMQAEAEAAQVERGKSEPETPLYTVIVMVYNDSDQASIEDALSMWSPARKTVGPRLRCLTSQAEQGDISTLLHKLAKCLEQHRPKEVRVSIEL
jgi:ParB-like chromosome segregation protein Spo0J